MGIVDKCVVLGGVILSQVSTKMDHSSSRHSATGHVRLMIVLFYCALAIALSGKCIQAAHHSYFGIRNEYASSHYWSGIIPTPKNVTQALAGTKATVKSCTQSR